MTAWGVPPVGALLDTDTGRHRIVWDGDRVVLANHDESDAVLDALGSPSCACFAISAGWSDLRSEPSILLALFDPPPSLAPGAQELFEIESFLLGTSTAPPMPASAKPVEPGLHHRVKDAFRATIPLLPAEFRTALLRAEIDALQAAWDDALLDPATVTALEHIVLVALRGSLSPALLRDIDIALYSGADSKLTKDSGGRITLTAGNTWLGDVAAQDDVSGWWHRAVESL